MKLYATTFKRKIIPLIFFDCLVKLRIEIQAKM